MESRAAVRILLVSVVVLLSACLTPAATQAGVNAGAVAHMYWQHGSGVGLSNRNSVDSIPQLVVTITGLKRFQGADVQLAIQGLDSLGNIVAVPPAWQAQSGGCAYSKAAFKVGSYEDGDTVAYWSAFDGVTGIATSQNSMYYKYTANTCVAPDTTGMIWSQSAGSATVDMDSTQEYGIFSFRLFLRAGGLTHCAGDLHDPNGPKPALITFNAHVPCESPPPTATIAVLADSAIDYVPIAAGGDSLTWEFSGEIQGGNQANLLLEDVWPKAIPTGGSTWLTIRGQHLDRVTTVRLRDSSGRPIPALSAYVADSTHVQALVNVPDISAGRQTLIASDTTGQDSLVNELTASRTCATVDILRPLPSYRLGNISIDGPHGGGTATEPSIAVGPEHILAYSSGVVNIYSKATGALLSSQCFNNFFRLGGCCSGFNPIYGDSGHGNDMTCFYDPLGGRFLALCFTQLPEVYKYHLHLLVSQTSSALGGWYDYHFPIYALPDRPVFGLSADKIAMSMTIPPEYFRVLDRNSVYNHLTIPYDKPEPYYPDSIAFYDQMDNLCCPVGYYRLGRNITPDSVMHVLSVDFSRGGNSIIYRTITGPADDFVLSDSTSIPLTTAFDASDVQSPTLAPQKGTDFLLDDAWGSQETGLSEVSVRDSVLTLAWPVLHLWPAAYPNGPIDTTAIACPETTNAIRAARIRITSLTPRPVAAVLQDAVMADHGMFYIHPAACDDAAGNVYIGFGGSSTNDFPSCYITAMRPSETTFEEYPHLVKAGEHWWGYPRPSWDQRQAGRWGDFTTMSIDQTANPPMVYYIGQWCKPAGTTVGNICKPDALPVDTMASWIQNYTMVWPAGGIEGRKGVGFALRPMRPNPSRGRATITFSVPRRTSVRLDIVDVQGRTVRRMVDGIVVAGMHDVVWDGRDGRGGRMASGVYLCRLAAEKWQAAEKIMLLH